MYIEVNIYIYTHILLCLYPHHGMDDQQATLKTYGASTALVAALWVSWTWAIPGSGGKDMDYMRVVLRVMQVIGLQKKRHKYIARTSPVTTSYSACFAFVSLKFHCVTLQWNIPVSELIVSYGPGSKAGSCLYCGMVRTSCAQGPT